MQSLSPLASHDHTDLPTAASGTDKSPVPFEQPHANRGYVAEGHRNSDSPAEASLHRGQSGTGPIARLYSRKTMLQ
jgi:hypothetical protein